MTEDLTWWQYHEDRMNQHLLKVLVHINLERLRNYYAALHDWQLNDEICHNLGIPSLDKPQEPELEPLEPKPAGWWYHQRQAGELA